MSNTKITNNPELVLDEEGSHNISELGFEDISGAKPYFHNESDVPREARGNKGANSSQRAVFRKNKKTLVESQPVKGFIEEPSSVRNSKYPYNSVTKTKSGHIIEIDDTPGHEALNIQHKGGSKVEILRDGTLKIIGKKNRFTSIIGDDDIIVSGTVNVSIHSDANIRVQGDMNCQVDGDQNLLIKGNQNVEIRGNSTTRVHGDHQTNVTGILLRDVRGSVTDRCLSNYLHWVVGTYTTNIGDDVQFTTEGKLTIISDESLNFESEGGYINIKGDDSYIITGVNYSKNYHASENFYGAAIHADEGFISSIDGDLEGTATKATYALTAGAAPTGSASPTTPSPTSPTSPTNSPVTDLDTVIVSSESDEYIKNLDRSVVNGEFQTYKLDTYEVGTRMMNKNLLRNSTWMQDQINTGAIIEPTGNAPNKRREYNQITNIATGDHTLGFDRSTLKTRAFKVPNNTKLKITKIPEKYLLTGNTILSSDTKLSPNVRLGEFLGGDSLDGKLIDQIGLSRLQISQNLQLTSYNILEILKRKYKTSFVVSNGLYNLLTNEKLDTSGLAYSLAQGLAIGIQLPNSSSSKYFDIAVDLSKNVIFDKIAINYIDYDPEGINEPTLYISINNGSNNKSLETYFNNEKISETLQDLSN